MGADAYSVSAWDEPRNTTNAASGPSQCCQETPDSIFENYDYVPRACYLTLAKPIRRYYTLFHSVLHLCAEFRESKPFLWLDINT